jgi:hypothetical protein
VLSAAGFEVGQDEQGAQERGGAGGVGAELGEDPPGLQMCEAVFDGGASGGQDPVGLLLAGGELAVAGGLVAGDDDLVIGILGLVDAEEAQVGERAEAGCLQVLDDLVAAGRGGVVGPAGPGGGDPDQVALLVGQGEEVQAVAVVLAGVVGPVRLPCPAFRVIQEFWSTCRAEGAGQRGGGW